MEAARGRFASIVEWLVAATFIAVVVAAGAIVLREFRTVNAVMPVSAREPAPPVSIPAAVPARSVSVPVLLLDDGKSVRVGDSLTEIAARLGREAEAGTMMEEPGGEGRRLSRAYEHAGTRFVLVFDSYTPQAEPIVAAIYVE